MPIVYLLKQPQDRIVRRAIGILMITDQIDGDWIATAGNRLLGSNGRMLIRDRHDSIEAARRTIIELFSAR